MLQQPEQPQPSQPAFSQDPETLQSHLVQNHRDICAHLYHQGFLNGFLSDIAICAFETTFHLHRLILARSPYFEQQLTRQKGVHKLFLNFHDEIIHQEAFSICLAFLYGAPIYSHVQTGNVHQVLACAHFLQLNDLAALCCDLIQKSRQKENILETVGFVTSGKQYGPYGQQLKDFCFQFLSTPTSLDPLQDWLSLYIYLPFSWLKPILESKLSFNTEFERFQFAKKVIEKRKLGQTVQLPFQSSTFIEPRSVQENVVLLFDKDTKGRVSVLEHLVKKPYLKHASK